MLNNILNLVAAIKERNQQSRIFIIGVLPRPIENDQAKIYIMKMNNATERIRKLFDKVCFLPVHLKFLNGGVPRMELFNQEDQLTLNPAGAMLFKQEVFRLAGFVRNE